MTTEWQIFAAGFAAGTTLLAASAYVWVSPRWLKGLLLACAAVMLGRAVALAAYLQDAPPSGWLRYAWFGSLIGLHFPALVAMDQLVRHPAMTPKTLLRVFSPFLAVYLVVMTFGDTQMVHDGWNLHRPVLFGWALWLLRFAHAAFILLVWWVGAWVIRKMPTRSIRVAMAGLMAAYAFFAIDGALGVAGWSYPRPFLYSEILCTLAIWWALHTAGSSNT